VIACAFSLGKARYVFSVHLDILLAPVAPESRPPVPGKASPPLCPLEYLMLLSLAARDGRSRVLFRVNYSVIIR
jgi:hypothetical protein